MKYLVLIGMLASINVFSQNIEMNDSLWGKENSPGWLSQAFKTHYQYKLNNLPTKGRLSNDQLPWANSYWPNRVGGIALQWQNLPKSAPSIQGPYDNFWETNDKINEAMESLKTTSSASKKARITSQIAQLNSLKKSYAASESKAIQRLLFDGTKRYTKKSQYKRMSQDQINRLSPAEKYDLYKDNYKLELTRHVLSTNQSTDPDWEGICHGWTSAAIEFYEPENKTITNKDGIQVTFYSSDIKALISLYHKELKTKVRTAYVGQVCKTAIPESGWLQKNGKEYYLTSSGLKEVPYECRGPNAGAFHIVLSNQIGRMNKSFAAEVVRDKEVWNQPISAFESEIIETIHNPTSPNTKITATQVRVKTKMSYADDGAYEFWDGSEIDYKFFAWTSPTNGTKDYREDSKDYEYILDLDRKGQIVGGKWISYERPDFLWMKVNKGFDSRRFRSKSKYLLGLKNFVRSR